MYNKQYVTSHLFCGINWSSPRVKNYLRALRKWRSLYLVGCCSRWPLWLFLVRCTWIRLINSANRRDVTENVVEDFDKRPITAFRTVYIGFIKTFFNEKESPWNKFKKKKQRSDCDSTSAHQRLHKPFRRLSQIGALGTSGHAFFSLR